MIARVLAIDPGKTSGYALFEVPVSTKKPKLKMSGCVSGDAVVDFHNMGAFIHNSDANILLIETQFFHPKRKAKNLMQLLENRFVWEFFARQQGCTVGRIDPAKWQSYWKLKSNLEIENKTKRGKDFKRQIVEKAKKVTRRKRMEENEADAILIGFYWLNAIKDSPHA